MRRVVTVMCAALLSAPAVAGEPEFELVCPPGPVFADGTSCQQNFDAIVQDMSAALGYKALHPAEATGVTGIGVGVFVNYAPTENEQAWKNLTGQNVDAVGMAGGVVHKGLPFGIDLGAFYSTVPGTSAGVWGAEVRYAILEGGVASPALAVRGAYTATTGIDDFDYDAWSADVSLSKGFTLITPYVGAGFVSATADPKGTVGLSKSTAENERLFVGFRLGLGLFDITPEYERIGDNNAYNLRLGLSF